MSPGQDYIEKWFLYQKPYRLTTNSLGFRDEELRYQDGLKILVLGDEPTFGAGVELKETYVQNLEKSLRDYLNREDIEVINGGSRFATIRDERVLLEKLIPEISPKIVILQVSLNDIAELKLDKFSCLFQETSTRRLPNILRETAVYVQLIRGKLSLLSVLKKQDFTGMREPLDAHSSFFAAEPSPFWDAAWNEYRMELKDISSICKENGLRFILLVLPSKLQVMNPNVPDFPQKTLFEYAASEGIVFIDTLSFFTNRFSNKKMDFFSDSSLLNADGQYNLSTFLFDNILNLVKEKS